METWYEVSRVQGESGVMSSERVCVRVVRVGGGGRVMVSHWYEPGTSQTNLPSVIV